MNPQRLKNPPITEALIDLRVEMSPDRSVEQLAAFHSAVASTYPESEKRMVMAGSFEMRPGGEPHVEIPPPQHLGFMCWTSDRVQAAQARLDGFTLNRLRPYVHWEHFSAEAKALWSEYVTIADPKAVVRIAVRYINRIEVPMKVEFDKYFKTHPTVGPGVPQAVANMLMRLVLGVAPKRGVVLTMASEAVNPETNGGMIPVILDIDASQEGTYSPTDPAIWNVLDELRDLKNRVFFESLTDEALETYK